METSQLQRRKSSSKHRNGSSRSVAVRPIHPSRATSVGSSIARPSKKEKVNKKARLELLRLKILKKCDKTWDLYFLVATEHPTKKNKTVLSIFPEGPTINFTKSTDNLYVFRPKGEGTDGMSLFATEIPEDRHLKIRVWLMQSKKKARRSGEVLEEVTGFLDKNVASTLGPAAAGNPYVAAGIVVNKGLNMVGGLISKVKDKDRGMANLDEKFGPEFNDKPNQRRTVEFSSGEAQITYRWCTRKK